MAVCDCKNDKGISFDFTELDAFLEEHGGYAGSLIPILQKAQDIYGYLPIPVIKRIAEKTGIKPSKILGVATFYAQFRLKPAGKYLIMLCQGTACHVNGAAGIEEAILSFLSTPEFQLYEGDVTPDGLFTLNNVACLGCCSLSPVMMINGETHGLLTPEKTRRILQSITDAEKAAKEAL